MFQFTDFCYFRPFAIMGGTEEFTTLFLGNTRNFPTFTIFPQTTKTKITTHSIQKLSKIQNILKILIPIQKHLVFLTIWTISIFQIFPIYWNFPTTRASNFKGNILIFRSMIFIICGKLLCSLFCRCSSCYNKRSYCISNVTQ